VVITSLHEDVLGLFQAKFLEPCLRSGGKTVVIAGDPFQTPTGYLLPKSLCQQHYWEIHETARTIERAAHHYGGVSCCQHDIKCQNALLLSTISGWSVAGLMSGECKV